MNLEEFRNRQKKVEELLNRVGVHRELYRHAVVMGSIQQYLLGSVTLDEALAGAVNELVKRELPSASGVNMAKQSLDDILLPAEWEPKPPLVNAVAEAMQKAVEEEREVCAKLAETRSADAGDAWHLVVANGKEIAVAIRERKDKP